MRETVLVITVDESDKPLIEGIHKIMTSDGLQEHLIDDFWDRTQKVFTGHSHSIPPAIVSSIIELVKAYEFKAPEEAMVFIDSDELEYPFRHTPNYV